MKNIKRLSLALATIFVLGSGVVMANEAHNKDKKVDPKVRAEKMTERMVKEYGLTDTQKQQVLELNQTLVKKIGDRPARHHHNGKKGKNGKIADANKQNKEQKADINKERKNKELARGERKHRSDIPKLSPEEREKRMTEMKQIRENYNTQLQKIMNADQFQAYTKKQAEREQKRQERGNKKHTDKSTTHNRQA